MLPCWTDCACESKCCISNDFIQSSCSVKMVKKLFEMLLADVGYVEVIFMTK